MRQHRLKLCGNTQAVNENGGVACCRENNGLLLLNPYVARYCGGGCTSMFSPLPLPSCPYEGWEIHTLRVTI
jgi:hypothetical protein